MTLQKSAISVVHEFPGQFPGLKYYTFVLCFPKIHWGPLLGVPGVFEAKKLPNPMNYLALANSCEKSAVTLPKHEVCGEKVGKKFENKFQPRPGLKLFVLFLRECLRDRHRAWIRHMYTTLKRKKGVRH